MRILFISVLLIVLSGRAGAQATLQPDSMVKVTMLTDAAYNGTLLEDIKGRYIRIWETNGSVTRLAYTSIQSIENSKGETIYTNAAIAPVAYKVQEGYQPAKPKASADVPPDRLFSTYIDHKFWNKLIIINGTDTLYAKAQPRDYSVADAYGDFSFNSFGIKVALRDGKLKKLPKKQLQQVIAYDYDGAMTKYLTITSPDKSPEFCRLVVDGKCQLFTNQTHTPRGSISAPMMGANGVWYGGYDGRNYAEVKSTDHYYVRYKDDYWMLCNHPDDQEVSFNRLGEAVFADCPDIAKKVGDGTYTCDTLEGIVREFNKCIK